MSDPILANHTRGNIQEVAARGAKVLTIAEENVAKETDDIVLTTVTPYPLTNLNGRTNSIGGLLLQHSTVALMWTNHVTLLSQ